MVALQLSVCFLQLPSTAHAELYGSMPAFCLLQSTLSEVAAGNDFRHKYAAQEPCQSPWHCSDADTPSNTSSSFDGI
jgi:hypothetical protein